MSDYKLKELMKAFVYTDVGDSFFVLKLETRMWDSFADLDSLKGLIYKAEQYLQEYADHIHVVRSCLTLLEWYSSENLDGYRKKVNEYASYLEGSFF